MALTLQQYWGLTKIKMRRPAAIAIGKDKTKYAAGMSRDLVHSR
jgi:hypothetical protein